MATDLLVEYIESLIEVAAQGNANEPEVHAKDIRTIIERDKEKQVIHVISEKTRDGEETWDLGAPSNITLDYHDFFFDQKNGDLQVDDIQEQIERLEELPQHPSIVAMIKERKEWLADNEENEREWKARQAEAEAAVLEKARQVLRQAGELPQEVPDGATPTDQA